MKCWNRSVAVCGMSGLILLVMSLAGPQPNAGAEPHHPVYANLASSQDKSSGGAADTSGYVGADTCKTCHEDIYNSWEKTPHWKTTLDTKGGPSHQGCEGCHGPGADHVAGGGDVTKIFIFKDHSAKEVNDRCMTCHASGPSQLDSPNSVHRMGM